MPENGTRARHRVLVVDDNPVNAKLLDAALRADGHEVAVVHEASRVHSAVGEFDPEIVLMDVQMPGKDGLTLTRELRAEPATAKLAVVAVTAYARPEDREAALAAGCNEYMSKPVDTRALSNVLDRVVAGLGPMVRT